ncbi:MAG: glycosyltransferase family 1 protein [Burkholderiales bacterium]|nr:glycosyltransferase family 1 protein [Anaerolineae bacterium]
MHITIVCVGSRGDAQPFVALGMGLRAAGHDVRVATHSIFESFVREHGLDFAAIEPNPVELLNSELGQQWIGSGSNPIRFVRGIFDIAAQVLEQLAADIERACQNTDAIVFSTFGILAYHVAEKLNIPAFSAELQPTHPTSAFPAIVAPRLPLSGIYNRASHALMRQTTWQMSRRAINRWRVESLGLPPIGLRGPYASANSRAHTMPVLFGYSPSVVPRPPDWPSWVHVCGYWFLNEGEGWHPPADLQAFLEAGPPPVYIGFGSMALQGHDPQRLILDALAQTGQRGLLLRGWGGLSGAVLPDNAFAIDAAPHDWLFPRMAAVVHHGGAGTTAAGLRAGKPTIICPFFADQPFWGQRVYELGGGPRPISQKRLTADNLAAAIRMTTSDENMKARASALGEHIRAEYGVANAVNAIESYMKTGD